VKTLDREGLQNLFLGLSHAQHPEIDCDGCFEAIHRCAEANLVGTECDEAMLSAQEHLARCAYCREEFEALLAALTSAVNEGSCPSTTP
jgi:hypothetical protein